MKFSDLIDATELQALCESFTAFTGAVTAVLDLEGNILVASGWQDICTHFHRINCSTAQRCRESDTVLAGQLSSGESYNVYKCKNGLIDVAVPVIIGGEHVGNFFTGQFFFEKPDIDFFIRQSEEFGFHKESYLEALNKAPIFSPDDVRNMMDFFTRLANLIGEMGLARRNQEATNSKLHDSTMLLQTIIDTVPMRVFWKDRSLRYIGCNPAFANDAGQKDPTQIISKTDSQLSWADHASIYENDDLNIIESGLPKLFYDEPRITAGNTMTWARTSKTPLKNQEDQVIGVLGIYEDITERKQAEIELRVASIALESQVCTVISNADGLILRVNQSFSTVTGYSVEEVIGRNTNILKSDRHDAVFYAAIWDDLKTTGSWKGEIWNRRKDGSIYPALLNITAVKGADGNVSHYVGNFSDISQRKEDEDKIKQLAFYDPLTSLPNRRLLTDRLTQALASSKRNGREGALLFVDLDNFKSINDSQGHGIGDLLLQGVGHRLNESLRDADTVARLGGDEFVVVLTDLNPDPTEAAAQAEDVGQKILNILGQSHLIQGKEFRSTPSIGITLFGNPCGNLDDLMRQADIAMYQAKAEGRNTMRFFDPMLQATIKARAALESDLIIAIQEDQLALYYQPQINNQGHLIGAEALVRWLHPKLGTIPPNEFIPLAEETGLILPLGNWVLEKACHQIAEWAENPKTAAITLAVNVSVHQIRQKDFVDLVHRTLNLTNANPRRLKLELTESVMVDNVQDIIDKMTALKSDGVSFSIDDFGTGYSSLSYLKRLPLDQLKIDQSFVRDVLTDQNEAVIAKTVVALAHSLGLEVIAEGVETVDQRKFLAEIGCQNFQGFLFSKPLPYAEFLNFIQHIPSLVIA